MPRVIGWVVTPLESVDVVHQPIGLTDDEQFILYNGLRLSPPAFLMTMGTSRVDILWTAREWTLHDASWYDSFTVNLAIQDQNQQTLQKQWTSFLRGEAPAPRTED